MTKARTKKRFTIILISMFSIMILPVVYSYIALAIELQQAVLTGLITIVSIYIGGQSLSDGAREFNNN